MTTKLTAGKRRLQNTVRRSRGHKTVTRLYQLLASIHEELLNDEITVPDLISSVALAKSWAAALDGRRGALDPSKGGKAV